MTRYQMFEELMCVKTWTKAQYEKARDLSIDIGEDVHIKNVYLKIFNQMTEKKFTAHHLGLGKKSVGDVISLFGQFNNLPAEVMG